MSEKRNAPVDTGISNKGEVDEVTAPSVYESTLADLFGQACLRILKLNERKGSDGYGCYSFDISDASIAVYYWDRNDEHHMDCVFNLYRSEIKKIGMATALRSLIEILDGEGDAE